MLLLWGNPPLHIPRSMIFFTLFFPFKLSQYILVLFTPSYPRQGNLKKRKRAYTHENPFPRTEEENRADGIFPSPKVHFSLFEIPGGGLCY